MRVVINRQAALGARTGIGHYTAELLRALRACGTGDEFHVYPTGLLWRLRGGVADSQPGGGGRPGSTARGPGLLRRVISAPAVRGALRIFQPLVFRNFRSVCRRENYDLYHEPNSVPMPCDCPTIATLHDLSAVAHPEWHPADRVQHYQQHLQRALAQCSHILTGSDFTRAEIIRELGIAPERVTRVYHGIREGLTPLPAATVAAGLQSLGLPPTYLLHVGTLEPRKNLEMLLRAWCDLPENVRERCPLLLVGKWGWNTAALAEVLEAEARHRGVIHLGYLAEEHLPLLYNGARALVFPTRYEGFGLPPLEMMACGGAVLASTAGAVAEVMGGGELIDPEDRVAWREAMRRVMVDDDWRQQLRRGVCERAAEFTWQRCAAATLHTYRQVLGVASTRPAAA